MVGHALWLRKEAARRGYAWRQQQRARQLSSLRTACVPPGGKCWRGLAVRAFWSRRLGGGASGAGNERGTRTSSSGTGSGEGAGARVAGRSVLEDHETAVLELERVVSSIEDCISELELQVSRVSDMLDKRERDFGELTKVVLEDIKVAGLLHDDLKRKVLHVEQQVESRVTRLEQWCTEITTTLNDVEGRVDNLEQWCEELAEIS